MSFNPLQSLKKLFVTVPKDRVSENYRFTMSELRERGIPAYGQANVFFNTDKPFSKEYEDLNKRFGNSIRLQKGFDMLKSIQAGLPVIAANLEAIYKQFDKEANEEIASDALTYPMGTMLRLMEAATLVSTFSLKLLDYIYVCETAAREKTDPKKDLRPVDIKEIDAKFMDFVIAFRALTKSPSDVKRNLDKIPNLVVSDDDLAAHAAIHDISSLDPFSMGFIGTKFNIFFAIGMAWADMQANRYRLNRERLALFQMRLKNLEQLNKKERDPRIEKEIVYLQDRIQKLENKIADAEQETFNNGR